MKKNGLSYIRKWLIIYLAMVMLTSLAMYVVIYVEVSDMVSTAHINSGGNVVSDHPSQTTKAIITGFQLRILMILTGGWIICLLCGMIWLAVASRRLRQPVRTISRAIGKLSKGQLNETVNIETSDELEHIGSNINELAANLQELLLHIWKQTGQCLTLIENIRSNPELRHDRQLTLEGLGYLKQLTVSIEDLREMAKAYVFYDVNIDGSGTTAVNDPGDLTPSTVSGKTSKNYY